MRIEQSHVAPTDGPRAAGTAEQAGRSAESPLALAGEGRTAPAGGASPLAALDVETLERSAEAARFVAQNPDLLRELQMYLREMGAKTKTQQIHNDQKQADHEHQLRMKALEAAKKGGRLLPGKLGEVLKVVAVAASVAASAVTGGASIGLLVAGAALMLAGPQVTKGLVKAGVIDEKAALGLDIAIQVAGSVMMAGAGAAGGAQTAAETGGKVGGEAAAKASAETAKAGAEAVKVGAQAGAETAKAGTEVGTAAKDVGEQVSEIEDIVAKTLKAIEAEAQIDGGLHTLDGTIADKKHADRMSRAATHGVRREQATEQVEGGVEGLATMLEQFERMAQRLQAAAEAKEQARAAVIAAIA